MKLIRILVLFTLAAFSVATFSAQSGQWMIKAGGGYIFFAPKRNLKNNIIPAYLGVGYNFDEHWAMEVMANLVNAKSGDPNKRHVHGFIYLWDQMYHLCQYKTFEPYVMGGVNVISLKPSNPETINQPGVNIGIGTEFLKSSNIALNAELRELYTFVGGKKDTLFNIGLVALFG